MADENKNTPPTTSTPTPPTAATAATAAPDGKGKAFAFNLGEVIPFQIAQIMAKFGCDRATAEKKIKDGEAWRAAENKKAADAKAKADEEAKAAKAKADAEAAKIGI